MFTRLCEDMTTTRPGAGFEEAPVAQSESQ